MSIALKILQLKRELAKHSGVVFTIELNRPAYEALRREIPLERNWNLKSEHETFLGIKIVRNEWSTLNSYFNEESK